MSRDPAERVARGARAVWAGLSTRTLSSCLGALLVAIGELFLACWLVQPRRLVLIPPRLLQSSEGDEYGALSLRLLRYHRTRSRALQVAYLGASTATHSLLTRDPGMLSEIVAKGVGRPVRFNVWSSNGQRYEDALVVAEALPPTFAGVFVLVVNDYKNDEREIELAFGDGRSRFIERILAEDAPARDELWREEGFEPRRTGVFFLDHLDFFASRRIAAVRLPPEASVEPRDRLAREPVPSLVRAHAMEAKRRRSNRSLGDPPILGENRRVIEKLVDKLTERGIITVFVEAPLNPNRAPFQSERMQRYYASMARYAAAHRILYWNWNDELAFTPADFRDQIHLAAPAARLRFQKRLTDGVVGVLKGSFEPAAPPAGGSEDEDEDRDG